MRVGFCIDNMNVGGTEMNALRTARRLIGCGISLRVFSLSKEGPLLQHYNDLGIPVHFLPIGRLYGAAAFRYGRDLAALIRQHEVQVVHAHDFYSNIFAGPWVRLAGASFIASRRWWLGPDRRAQRWANRCAYVLAHRVLANTQSVARLLTDVERVPASRVVVIPNFLDESAFADPPPGWSDALAAELDLPAERLVVGVVASLRPIKDHATLLQSIALLAPRWPQLFLVLVGGDGGSRGDLEELAGELGIAERVRFAGLRPNQPSAHYFFDISALTSLSEGLPNSILEAMAARRPVVATRVGGIPDVVVDNQTGKLVAARDPRQLTSALETYLESPQARLRAGDSGRMRALQHYSAAAAIAGLLEVYVSLRGPSRRTTSGT